MSLPSLDHDALMRAAMDAARRGRFAVEPNPRVGAIALAGDEVVGVGHHRVWGGAHAEAEALAAAQGLAAAQAQGRSKVDTVVVTLEPCSARPGEGGKKRPPCTEALLDRGVRRVIVGATDPDPRHRGEGLRELERRGVEVVSGVLEAECAALNPFFTRWLGSDRPWTIAKWAMSLDGKIAAASGDARWISSEAARREVHELRARVDAVVVGYRTALRDDPQLTARGPGLDGGPQPVRVVLDPRAEIPSSLRVVQSAREVPTWIVAREDSDAAARRRLEAAGVRVLCVAGRGARGLDLAAAWRALRRDGGLRRLLAEGGGATLAALHRAGCLDQVVAYVAMRLIGGAKAPTPLDGEGVARVVEGATFEEQDWRQVGADLEVRGILAAAAATGAAD